MKKKLKKLVKEIDGSLIVIDENESLISNIRSNKKIKLFFSLSEVSKKSNLNVVEVSSDLDIGNTKIKRVKQKFKKYNIDYVFLNMKYVSKYIRKLIRDSVIIASKEVCIYGNGDDMDCEVIVKRLKRFASDVKLYEYGDDYIIVANTNNKKKRTLFLPIYFVIDLLSDMSMLISNVLVS